MKYPVTCSILGFFGIAGIVLTIYFNVTFKRIDIPKGSIGIVWQEDKHLTIESIHKSGILFIQHSSTVNIYPDFDTGAIKETL